MGEIHIRRQGRTGRITLQRPKALNALSYEMCLAIEAALDGWRDDPEVALVVIDAEGDRAFCAGGDIQEMYDTAREGNFEYGRTFWRDEYRLNDKIAEYPKPYVALMQGFTMGGGVGISCHGSHRIVCGSSQIAMPECGIGLIPDVGGSLLLARAPGHLGEYLGLSATRMGPGDAIHAGFADTYVPREKWPRMLADLEETGAAEVIGAYAEAPPESPMAEQQGAIDALFAGKRLTDILGHLEAADSDLARGALKAIRRNSPLSAACTVELIHRVRVADDIRAALDLEYRFTYRSAEDGDFIEGIRAAIIDKDRNPHWQHDAPEEVTRAEIDHMLAPLGDAALKL
jgi:enoyl-CoA hydratase